MIVFTSYRDDFYGGDRNKALAVTAPADSDWNYVTVDGTAIDPQVRFKNCIFRYGGSGTTQGALRAVNSSPTADSTIFAYNTVGLSVEGASNPTARGCSFIGNTNFGINNTGNSFCVNAEGSWWGAANGPNDAAATADLCALGSNAGSGDKVSNNVDYAPYAATGIVNALIGDVSLNGVVRAFDAAMVLQYLASIITVNDLQKLVADVSGVGGITGMDATLILQWVAGVIPAFPAESNRPRPAPPDVAVALEVMRRATGTFDVSLGTPNRVGEQWEGPVLVTGSAPGYAFELRLEDGAAATLAAAELTNGANALQEHNVADGRAFVVVAGIDPMAQGQGMGLRFAAPAAGRVAPPLASPPAHRTVVLDGTLAVPPATVPARAFLAAP